MSRSERFEILIRATADDVWDRLTTPEGLRSWFGTRAEIDLRLDGERVIGWGDDPGEISGRLTGIEPGKRLRVTYFADGREVGAEEWLIATEGDTVRLTLIHSLADEGVEDWEGFYGDIRRGWRLFMASLQFALEEATTRDRTVSCRFVPVDGDRARIWEEVIGRVAGSDLVAGMERRLVDPPHSLLLTAPEKSLLLDIEGSQEAPVLYAQASRHGGPADHWIAEALSVVERVAN